MQQDFTQGAIRPALIRFSVPLMAGNLLQQLYNLVDTWVVGRYLGKEALAAVGSAFSLMTLLTSILLGLSMGSSVVFSQFWGQQDSKRFKQSVANAFGLLVLVTVVLLCVAYGSLSAVTKLMRVPREVEGYFTLYLSVIFAGIPFIFLYNFYAALLRSVGNTVPALVCLFIATLTNIVLDVLFVLVFPFGIAGAAWATVIAQGFSALALLFYTIVKKPQLNFSLKDCSPDYALLRRLASVSFLTGMQQSIMNFGILMIQSLVNSFGVATMAAFAAGVKIDAFAYAPAQDFANGFTTFVAQNKGAQKPERIIQGIKEAFLLSCTFCLILSLVIFFCAPILLTLFIDPGQKEVLDIGVQYLRWEGSFYVGIGMLFLFYAIFRGLERAGVSVVLTIISLGLRVLIAYTLAPVFGVLAIWISVPIGWFVADIVGFLILLRNKSSY